MSAHVLALLMVVLPAHGASAVVPVAPSASMTTSTSTSTSTSTTSTSTSTSTTTTSTSTSSTSTRTRTSSVGPSPSTIAIAASSQDTLRLAALQDSAVLHDPRFRQVALRERATALELRNLSAERLPQLRLTGEATHQSEVAELPISLPSGEPPRPPNDRYEIALNVDWSVFDGGLRGARSAAERASLAAELAALTATLHPLRMQVLDAYFNTLLLQEQALTLDGLITDLAARLREVRAQVQAGSALPSDTAVLLAELLAAHQQHAELAADRRAALAILSQLTGRTVADGDVLNLPALDAAFATARGDTLPRAHPQYAVFAARRAQLAQQTDIVAAAERPQVAAFGELAWGSPGLQQFTDEPHDYWIAGLRVQWQPWSWGAIDRDIEALRVERQILDTEEAALTARLEREVQQPAEAIARLRAALATDERIIALRAQVEQQARAQLAERAIMPAVYVDALTDLQDARITRARHRVELTRAQAQYLTTLGVRLP